MVSGSDKLPTSMLTWYVTFSEELLQLHRGQGMDLFWRDSLTCPTEKEYIDMVLGSGSSLEIQIMGN